MSSDMSCPGPHSWSLMRWSQLMADFLLTQPTAIMMLSCRKSQAEPSLKGTEVAAVWQDWTPSLP